MQPPAGVHWVEVYDENACENCDPEWIFDLYHPPECEEEIPTAGVCKAHKDEGAPQGRFKSERDEGLAFREMAGWCEDCAVAGPRVIEPHCGLQFEADNVGADAYAAGPEWPEDPEKKHRYFHERADIEAGVYRVTHHIESSGRDYWGEYDYTAWIEVHERVDVRTPS
jgi:hypothetical protein